MWKSWLYESRFKKKKQRRKSCLSFLLFSVWFVCFKQYFQTHKKLKLGRTWGFQSLQEFSPVSDVQMLCCLKGELLRVDQLICWMSSLGILSLTAFLLNDVHVLPHLLCFSQCQSSEILAAFSHVPLYGSHYHILSLLLLHGELNPLSLSFCTDIIKAYRSYSPLSASNVLFLESLTFYTSGFPTFVFTKQG